MDLIKLYETQKVLRDRIGYNEPDRFDKTILELLVELGECANNWRGFKYWSKDKEPIAKVTCDMCKGQGVVYFTIFSEPEPDFDQCEACLGHGYIEGKNPLLEEYVDGLSVILDLGLEIEFDYEEFDSIFNLKPAKMPRITMQFIRINQVVTDFWGDNAEDIYINMFEYFVGLGEMLGFTWKQIEQAYFEKNAINHKRQEEGY